MNDVTIAAAQLVPLGAAAVAAAVPFVVPLLRRALGWHINAAQGAIIDRAVLRGAALAAQVVQAGDASAPLRNGAVAAGVEYVMRRVPDALAALGLTPVHVEEMVSAELTRLMPGVPAMTRSPAPPAAAPAAAGTAPATGAVARTLGMLALVVAAGGALSACSAQQRATALSVVQKACIVDGQIVPLGDAALSGVGGAPGAAVAQVDATAIHPAVAAACAKLEGTPVLLSQPATPAGTVVSGTVPLVTPLPSAGAAPTQPAK